MGGGSGTAGSICFLGSLADSKESLLALDSCIFEDLLAEGGYRRCLSFHGSRLMVAVMNITC